MCKRPGRDDYSCDFELSRHCDIKWTYSADRLWMFGAVFGDALWKEFGFWSTHLVKLFNNIISGVIFQLIVFFSSYFMDIGENDIAVFVLSILLFFYKIWLFLWNVSISLLKKRFQKNLCYILLK